MKPRRPALRYFGGKWRLAPLIIPHFPLHTCYVEPYGGGASILLQKDPSQLEVYNDLNGDVVNYFRVLREQPDDLIKLINLTPFAREEYELSFKPTDDPLERARRVFVQSFQSYGSHINRKSGWRFEKNRKSGGTAIGGWNRINHLNAAAERLKWVQIDNDDALKVIDRFDAEETLFYLDPPYIESTLSSGHRYKHSLSEDDHIELLKMITAIKGMAIISMNDHPTYNELLGGWEKVSFLNRSQNGSKKEEFIWISPNCAERMPEPKPEQSEMWIASEGVEPNAGL